MGSGDSLLFFELSPVSDLPPLVLLLLLLLSLLVTVLLLVLLVVVAAVAAEADDDAAAAAVGTVSEELVPDALVGVSVVGVPELDDGAAMDSDADDAEFAFLSVWRWW